MSVNNSQSTRARWIEEIDPILRFPEVKRITGLSRSSVYDLMGKNTFPKAIPLGGRSVGWLESEVVAWRRGRIELRDQAQATVNSAAERQAV